MTGPQINSTLQRWILHRLLAAIGDPPISIVLPDGSEIHPASGQAVSRVTIQDRRTLYKLAINPLFQFPEAYASGAIDVEFIEDDWRKISGRCDAFVSVGMLEHVGKRNYQTLGAVIDACLKPQGVGLIHSIGQNFLYPHRERVSIGHRGASSRLKPHPRVNTETTSYGGASE